MTLFRQAGQRSFPTFATAISATATKKITVPAVDEWKMTLATTEIISAAPIILNT